MAIQTIRSYFEGTLKAWADVQSPVLPVSFENVSFAKPSTGSFLECFLLPNLTINPAVNGIRKREIGIFQVNIWTRINTGSRDAMSIAQGIVNLFPLVPKGAVSVEKTPSIEKSILDNSGWFITPVTVEYRLES